ncbi:hypothetical protein B0A48_16031 [Cryoendolithus antarcticus]|uniref:Vezatin n=1 Tax=Cryoendolithus antarcticus TaxID=1507870 RepID=A0A1V8SFU1_9PEZI|nr:hypothetical protein B0A48_16031 [Cryoendolithus antarcticus]
MNSGDGTYEPEVEDHCQAASTHTNDVPLAFAPSGNGTITNRRRRHTLPPLQTIAPQQVPNRAVQLRNAWSSAVNSRLGRADNEKFVEHIRYLLVASQLLSEYLDQGSLQLPLVPVRGGLDGTAEVPGLTISNGNLYGVAVAASAAFAVVWLISWARTSNGGYVDRSRVTLVAAILAFIGAVGYAYIRKRLLRNLRRGAVDATSDLTASWQAFEVASTSALQLIQEVELVSKGYRISTPMPPVSRMEDSASRRCARLRKMLQKGYAALIPACISAITTLQTLIDEDDLDRYFEVYDINAQDAKEATGLDALSVLEDDPESLKSLRVLSYRAGILRRITLCALMSLQADGGKPDFARWRTASEVMRSLHSTTLTSAEKLRAVLADMDSLQVPTTPATKGLHSRTPTRERMRSQVRKISALSSGIRGLQAKMQILREETTHSLENTEDLTDLGPNLLAQYDSIGADLRELMQAWEAGKASLQTNITKHEKRLSYASSTASGLRSPVSSLGGLTAVDEDGSPADALRALNGMMSKRSSSATSPSEAEDGEAVFEAIALPKQRSTLTREERIAKMQSERERRASLMVKRETNTSMLRELESVINLRPKNGDPGASARVTSV